MLGSELDNGAKNLGEGNEDYWRNENEVREKRFDDCAGEDKMH